MIISITEAKIIAAALLLLGVVWRYNPLDFSSSWFRQSKATHVKTFTNRDGIEFCWVPAGTLHPTYLIHKWDTERRVDRSGLYRFNKGFWVSKYEITQTQWEHVMRKYPHKFDTAHTYNPSQWGGSNHPVNCVCAYLAKRLLEKLNRAGSKFEYSLPSEDEFQYACGKKHTTMKIDDYAWWGGNSEGEPHRVGLKWPNEFGLHDMMGNVQELCIATRTSPYGYANYDKKIDYYVLCGGHWSCGRLHCVPERRHVVCGGGTLYRCGIRLVARERFH